MDTTTDKITSGAAESAATVRRDWADLKGGRAVVLLHAPSDGQVTGRARFVSVVEAADPTASLEGTLNGAALPTKSDSHFATAELVLDIGPIPVMRDTDLTFETLRRNHHARESTRFEMWLEFRKS